MLGTDLGSSVRAISTLTAEPSSFYFFFKKRFILFLSCTFSRTAQRIKRIIVTGELSEHQNDLTKSEHSQTCSHGLISIFFFFLDLLFLRVFFSPYHKGL